MSIWRTLSNWGVSGQDKHLKRNIILCNRVSLLISLFAFILFFVSLAFFGWIYSTYLVMCCAFCFLIPLFLNKVGFTNSSRIGLSLFIPLASVVISIIDKFDYFKMEEFQYFEFRLTLLTGSLIPFVLFKLSERTYWISVMSFNLFCLALYDPAHEFFGVGYYQIGFSGPNYYFLNFMVLACFFVLTVSTYFLKYSFEKYEIQNELLISQLSTQQEEIMTGNRVIEKQKEMLSQENLELNQELLETNTALNKTNTELIRHNNDLQQFSYTISHNLRGPVASLMGLVNLLKKETFSDKDQLVWEHVEQSLTSLNTIIKDLSSIIDIRNAVTQVRQKVRLEDEIENIKSLLRNQINEYAVTIETDFKAASEILSVKPMVNSILYNLISNAIKYRSADRNPHIKVTTTIADNQIRIDVSDNGLGLDIERYQDRLFGLYKRFHTHMEGKGLGLFLVKLQAEALDGRVEVKSKLGEGSTFSVYLKMPEVTEEVLLDSSVARIMYNSQLNSMTCFWKRSATIEEYKYLFVPIVEFMKNFRLTSWIADITNFYVESDDFHEARKEIASKFQANRIKRLAFVLKRNGLTSEEYLKREMTMRNAYDPLDLKFFEDMQQALDWVESKNPKIRQTQ